MAPKDVDRMANSVDPDQTAPEEQSDQNLHCLLRHTCPNIWNFYKVVQLMTNESDSDEAAPKEHFKLPLHTHELAFMLP